MTTIILVMTINYILQSSYSHAVRWTGTSKQIEKKDTDITDERDGRKLIDGKSDSLMNCFNIWLHQNSNNTFRKCINRSSIQKNDVDFYIKNGICSGHAVVPKEGLSDEDLFKSFYI